LFPAVLNEKHRGTLTRARAQTIAKLIDATCPARRLGSLRQPPAGEISYR